MAFSKAPSQDTYQSQELKLIEALGTRTNSLAKDPILVNGFYEIVSNKMTKDETYRAVKRDGCSAFSYIPESANIRGMHYWEDENKLFIAYDIYVDIVNVATGVRTSHLGFFEAGTGPVSFTEFYFDNGDVLVICGDGLRLWSVNKAEAYVQTTDPDLPTPFIPSLVFLDGYLFLVKAGTSDIYNSDLNSTLNWTPGNFLTAEMLPDTVKGISRLNNYLIAFGTSSIEYFFDAGNPSGSPLQRNDTPVKQIGFLGGYAAYGNKIFIVGQYANTTPELYVLEDFKVDEVNLPQLRRFMGESVTYSAAIVTNGGHDFYVLSFGNETFALDLETKLWTIWKFQLDSNFPITYSALIKNTASFSSIVSVTGKANLFQFLPTVYQDNAQNFDFEGILDRNYFNTQRKKYMSRLIVAGDRVNSTLAINYTDDDYQTFSAERTVSLNQDRPTLTRLGSFFSRAFRFRHRDNTPCRLFMFELDYNIGGR